MLKTQDQLMDMYKKECRKNNKEISWNDFLNNYIPNYLKAENKINVNI